MKNAKIKKVYEKPKLTEIELNDLDKLHATFGIVHYLSHG